MQVPITLMILNKSSKLNRFTMPSDWGCKAVVLVLWIPSNEHTS